MSGEAAGVAGEAGLPGAGLLGLALKLGARVFRKNEEENIKLLGKYKDFIRFGYKQGCYDLICNRS